MSGAKSKGSMTVFATMSIMLVAAFLFALLESARIVEMRKIVQMNTDSVLESVFAAYELPMWESYHLLMWDAGGNGQISFAEKEAYLRDLSKDMLISKAANLLQVEMTEVSFDHYLLITDEKGSAFIAAVAAYMKRFFPLESVKQIYGNYEAVNELEQSQKGDTAAFEKSLEALEMIEDSDSDIAETDISSFNNEQESYSMEKSQENLLEIVKNAKSSRILNLVISNENTVSNAVVELSGVASHRKLESGTGKLDAQPSWLDSILLEQYLITYFSSYTDVMEDRALQYELEYLLCGKNNDAENLEGSVLRILGIREAANFLYLMSDAAKQGEAMAVATAIAGVTANPAVIEVVKLGLLAAWAFAESILDIRALLDGDVIPLIKSPAQWTSDLYNLPSVFTGSNKAKSSGTGLSYTSYIGILLFFQNADTLAYRAMDMQEVSVRMLDGYHDFQMDHMVLEAEITARYRAHSIFLGMESITAGMEREFGMTGNSAYSYRKAGV